jgi:hypothetical protein
LSSCSRCGAPTSTRGAWRTSTSTGRRTATPPCNAFKQGTAPLFLISLKAGGTGLNLTAADTVIHSTRGGTPRSKTRPPTAPTASARQRAVTVYRLVAKGTVEEKIQTLKARKRELAEAVIAESVGPLQALTEDDLDALLGGVVSG